MTHAFRLSRLDELLTEYAGLWRPTPFHTPRPPWCAAFPALAESALAMEEGQAVRLAGDNGGLIAWIGEYIPALAELGELICLPRTGEASAVAPRSLDWGVPGRKWAQVEAFSTAVGEPAAPVLEWCAGKGHLGRQLASTWGVGVTSLDRDAGLCADGADLARRAGVAQAFVQVDVLAQPVHGHLEGRHSVALHACGDLHLALLRGAVAAGAPALDLAPCCYYRTIQDRYQPLCEEARLSLSRDELHLAVTETVTAGSRDRRLADQAQAWKLAFMELRAANGIPREKTFCPVPGGWLTLGFSGWMKRLCAREAVPVPEGVDWAALERAGWQRQAEVRRLDLARLAFRRPLELWLVLDRALYLERHGYRVRVSEFCGRGLTPRNLLISARLGGMTTAGGGDV